MFRPTQISIPTLVRIKEGALDRVGLYLSRNRHTKVTVLVSKGLSATLLDRFSRSLTSPAIESVAPIEIVDNDLEMAARFFVELPKATSAIVGMGGGKALDVAKYVAFLGRLPYYSVPTSLSNDGFCSPQSSLTVRGQRRSLPAALPRAVVIDTGVCRDAPKILTLSGVGDLVAKFTAVRDWKLAFHATGEAVDDFAALLSDGSIHSFRSHPVFDLEGIRLLATSLMLNGIAMEIAGSSRPASGSEHLISHALDSISARPRLHGLQVGIASYLMSLVQQENSQTIAELFDRTGFWEAIIADPFSRAEWREAIRIAPTMKENFFTVLSNSDRISEAESYLSTDTWLARCFQD